MAFPWNASSFRSYLSSLSRNTLMHLHSLPSLRTFTFASTQIFRLVSPRGWNERPRVLSRKSYSCLNFLLPAFRTMDILLYAKLIRKIPARNVNQNNSRISCIFLEALGSYRIVHNNVLTITIWSRSIEIYSRDMLHTKVSPLFHICLFKLKF